MFHILDGEKFNNVKKKSTEMRAERKNRGNESYCVDSELFLVYIYKKGVYYVQDTNYDPWSDI